MLPCRFRVTRYFSRPPPQDASELRVGAGKVDIGADEGLEFVAHKLLLPSQPTYLLGSDHALSVRRRPSSVRSLVEACSWKAHGRRVPDRILFCQPNAVVMVFDDFLLETIAGCYPGIIVAIGGLA